MPAYSINIDGRVYEGYYGDKPNAVFGAMRQDSIDRHRAVSALAPAKEDHAQGCASLAEKWGRCDCGAWDTCHEASRELGREDKGPTLIGVEIVTGRKVAKKIHRIP